MNVDDMAVMMDLLDADGDGKVSKAEFGAYYKRLHHCEDATVDAVWRAIDRDGDGNLTLKELCDYFGISANECASTMKAQREMDDDRVLEALQLQSLINEERAKQRQQQTAHAARFRALADLAEEMAVEDKGAMASPTVSAKPSATALPPMTMEELTRQARRRGAEEPTWRWKSPPGGGALSF